MRFYIEAVGCPVMQPGLQRLRLGGEWEISGIPEEKLERVTQLVREDIVRYRKDDPEAIREVEWATGTMKIVFDPSKHTVEQIEFFVQNAVYRACRHEPRPA